MTTLELNLERILKVRSADLGLFVLAMHSLIERSLKEKYGISGGFDSDNAFGTLINRYTSEYYEKHGRPIYKGSEKRTLSKEEWAVYQSLKKLYTNHFLSNSVRHSFEEISPEDAQSTIQCFLAFAESEKWGALRALEELKKELENWDNHSSYQSEELTKAIAQIDQLKKENHNLAEKANAYNELQNQLNVVTARESLLKNELANTEARLSKKDAKLDEVRQKANEQMMNFKQEKEKILSQMKEYEATKQYLSYLEKVAFYSKTRHDYEASVTKLTSEQNDILEQIKLDKDFLIKGAAGTGKSLVLLKSLEKAVKDFNSQLDFDKAKNTFRLLTYTKSLVKYNQYVTKILGTEVPDGTITTADSFLFSMLKKIFPNKRLSFGIDKSYEGLFSCEGFTEKEAFTECQEFIWANCITKDEYIEKMCDRNGMKTPLKKEERITIWTTLERAEKSLEELSVWPRNFAAKKLIEALEGVGESGTTEELFAEYSFVDEAQDLPPVILALIKKSTKRGVFLAGDSDQSIYRKGFNWSRSGVDIRGRSRILKMNFRNTNQIHAFAESYRSKFKNMDKALKPVAYRPGPPVEISTGKNSADLMNQMVQQVKMLLNALNYDEENICIIANQKQKLEKLQSLLDKELGIKSQQIVDDFDFAETKGIRLCTMQNCKGLDFPVVLLLADHRIQGAEQQSIFDSETYYEQQYNMVYVCLTRAMEMLQIFTAENTAFAPFKDLKQE